MPPPAGLGGRGRALWRRLRPVPEPPVLRLDDVRRRLEILVAAVYGRPIPIVATEPPEPRHWARRLFFPEPGHLRRDELLAAADADLRVHLPPQLDAAEGEQAALTRYRLMAIAQAERVARGTPLHAPDLNPRWNRHLYAAGALTQSENAAPIRDLYVLLEGAAVDAAIERAVRCVEAGADGIFAEAAYDLPTYARFVEAVKVPVLANITEFGKTPLFTLQERNTLVQESIGPLPKGI